MQTTCNDERLRYWAQREVTRIYEEVGSWASVASELSAYLDISSSAWWHVWRGEDITMEKVNALRARIGLWALPTLKVVRSLPESKRDKRRCLHVSRELYDKLMGKKGSLTQEQFMERCLELWEQDNASHVALRGNDAF